MQLKPYAYCCAEGGGYPDACDCVNKDHGFAAFSDSTCTILTCRNRASAGHALCSRHRDYQHPELIIAQERFVLYVEQGNRMETRRSEALRLLRKAMELTDSTNDMSVSAYISTAIDELTSRIEHEEAGEPPLFR